MSERQRDSKRARKLIITDPHKFTPNEGIFSTIPIHTFIFNTSILYNGIHCTGEISGSRSDSAKDSGGSESEAVSWVTLGVLKPLPSLKALGNTQSHSVTSLFHLLPIIIDSLRVGRSGDRIPVGGEIFRAFPDWPWSPPSLLYNGYILVRGGKAGGT